MRRSSPKFCGGGYDRNEVNLLLLAHSLEKGMGIEKPCKGFGQEKAAQLVNEIYTYASRVEQPTLKYVYNEAMSVLEKYIQFSVDSGVDVSVLAADYQKLLEQYGAESIRAGYSEIETDTLYESIDTESARYFMTSRHSIRSYENRPVSAVEMDKILAVASTAPSACNRQPIKIFWTNTPDSVSRMSEYIPGNKGFEDAIPNWAIVTADRAKFGEQEVLQWYVNGGIYVAHLVQAFHAYGIGSCIFQIPIGLDHAEDIREIAGIPNHYAIVCAVGFGYPKQTVKCLAAARKPTNEYGIQF